MLETAPKAGAAIVSASLGVVKLILEHDVEGAELSRWVRAKTQRA